MTPEFWITTAAIFAGPVVAVLITHHLQSNKDRNLRRLAVFKSLMATRRTPLSPERVQALNLVEVEFHGKKRVAREFKGLLKLYNDQPRWKSEDAEIKQRLLQEVDDQTASLLKEMGQVLGYDFEGLELLRGGYYPEAFSIIESEQEAIRHFLVGLHNGTRVLPTAVLDLRKADNTVNPCQALGTGEGVAQNENGGV